MSLDNLPQEVSKGAGQSANLERERETRFHGEQAQKHRVFQPAGLPGNATPTSQTETWITGSLRSRFACLPLVHWFTLLDLEPLCKQNDVPLFWSVPPSRNGVVPKTACTGPIHSVAMYNRFCLTLLPSKDQKLEPLVVAFHQVGSGATPQSSYI